MYLIMTEDLTVEDVIQKLKDVGYYGAANYVENLLKQTQIEVDREIKNNYKNNNINMQEQKIFFYEFSDIDSDPSLFTSAHNFISWCSGCNIRLMACNMTYFNEHPVVYAICKKDKPELILASNRTDLKRNYHKYMKRMRNRA